jgi:hypothetical protein
VRFTLLVLAVLAMFGLGACAGDDESATPPPLEQRFVSADEAPGSNPDPVETRQTTEDFDAFVAMLNERSFNPDSGDIADAFREDDFVSAGEDTRFYGDTHTPGSSSHVFSSFIELESEDGAASALDWLETDVRKPCPMSCATEVSSFNVADIPGARGVRRIATAEDIERLGTTNERPYESYWVGFGDGALVYTAELVGRPGAVTEEQAVEIARAYHDRLTGD